MDNPIDPKDRELNDRLSQILKDASRLSRRFARGGAVDNDDIAQNVAIYQWLRGDTAKVNFATVRSRSYDALRSGRRRTKAESDAASHSDQVANSKTDDLEGLAAHREEVHRFLGSLIQVSNLTHNQEMFLFQHFAQSFSIKEISLMWMIDEKQVGREITNGLDKVRRVLWQLKQ